MSNCTGKCAQGRHCTCRDNTDDLIDSLLSFVQLVLLFGLIIFITFGLIGYWSSL